MNTNENYEITEQVCANTPDGSHVIIMRMLLKDSGRTVWVIGDDQCCAVTKEDFVRNRGVDYNGVLIQEFPYGESTPESVGEWRPLIEELVKHTMLKYLEHDGLIHIYPQWLPDDVNPWAGKELFGEMCRSCDHIILRENNMMEFVPKKL